VMIDGEVPPDDQPLDRPPTDTEATAIIDD
jgi:hypothetical protein